MTREELFALWRTDPITYFDRFPWRETDKSNHYALYMRRSFQVCFEQEFGETKVIVRSDYEGDHEVVNGFRQKGRRITKTFVASLNDLKLEADGFVSGFYMDKLA